ncbi:unnamed protein product [Euphydryas editha]|uniref:Uncharacterized protein n=1 Tax=Euphydryas editha TaxID=104508 RepID=A0AAU9TMB3_EUPED|nr:unnamed protein product [Euphydryas editha]
MLVKLSSHFLLMSYPDVDMLKHKDNFTMECVLPRRPKQNLPPLPEDREYSNVEYKKSKLVHRKRRQRRQVSLPVLPESDEC